MDVEHVAKARVRRENESPALDELHTEIVRGEMSNAHCGCLLLRPPLDADIPLARIQRGTSPVGWRPSRGIGLV